MKYLTRWAPTALVILLFFVVMNVKADPDRFWGGKIQGDQAVYQKDDLHLLRKYLEAEEVHYVLREVAKPYQPRSLTIYYDDGEENLAVNAWTCRKINKAFPKAQLRSLSIVNINDVRKGKTDFDCE